MEDQKSRISNTEQNEEEFSLALEYFVVDEPLKLCLLTPL